MLFALLAAFATYIYLQWSAFVATIIIFAFIALILFAIGSIYVSENPDAKDIEKVRTGKNRLLKWGVALSIVAVMMPSQKTLGTAVAVGAAAYATHAVVTSDVVQKFLLLVNKEANTMMDERLNELQKAASK
jgi:hypothetical protein